MKSWYLIHSKPRQERIARENLDRQGFETYLPLVSVQRRRRGRATRVIDPMFPRYLFISLSNETDDWQPIRSTIGVSNLVRFGQIPAIIPDSLITSLRARENTDGFQIVPVKEFQKGDEVRITEGPMEGYEGIFQSRNGKERVTLLLMLADNSARIQVEAGQIESV